MKRGNLSESPYAFKKGEILEIKEITDSEKFFKISLGQEELNHEPGQFVMISVLGVGEVPISVSSSPTRRGNFELVIRKVGKVTEAIHKLKIGSFVGVRGPFGKGFPVKLLEGNDLLLVAGGLGIVPLHSLIDFVIDNRRDFGKVTILLGCKSLDDMLFSKQLHHWQERLDVNFSCTLDKADPDWKGNVGMITSLIPKVDLEPERTYSVVVGPPVMYKFVIEELLKKRINEKHIFLSLERHMKCGVGKCGHCQINDLYCCQDGPVFSYCQIKDKLEAL